MKAAILVLALGSGILADTTSSNPLRRQAETPASGSSIQTPSTSVMSTTMVRPVAASAESTSTEPSTRPQLVGTGGLPLPSRPPTNSTKLQASEPPKLPHVPSNVSYSWPGLPGCPHGSVPDTGAHARLRRRCTESPPMSNMTLPMGNASASNITRPRLVRRGPVLRLPGQPLPRAPQMTMGLSSSVPSASQAEPTAAGASDAGNTAPVVIPAATDGLRPNATAPAPFMGAAAVHQAAAGLVVGATVAFFLF